MNYAAIKKCDIANGTGVRTSLFVSGCRHHCKGCFQPETWDFDFGNEFTVFVMSYKPNTEKRVYTVDTINEAVLQEIDGQTFHLSFEDIYVGISPYELSANDIMTIIGSINNNQ